MSPLLEPYCPCPHCRRLDAQDRVETAIGLADGIDEARAEMGADELPGVCG